MKVPNHTLFGERIYNMTDTTGGAVHEFAIVFNLFGGSNANTVSTSVAPLCRSCLSLKPADVFAL